MAAGWKLAIDFGTSNTAAAHTSPRSGEVETVALTHGGNLLVSAVYVETNGAIAVGASAANRADADPTGFLAFPKRSVGSEVVQVRDRQVAVADIVASVIRAAYRQALRSHSEVPPETVVLTHPEAWSKYDLAMLKEAARRAGIAPETVVLVSEPRAAAFYYTRTNALAGGEHIGVFDFGGGTLDVAVLTRTSEGDFRVVAARGDNGLGGRNFDALIRRWVDEELEEINPPLKDYLGTAASPSVLRALEASIRSAKEVLSEEPTATVSINAPSSNESLLLTRSEFENLAGSEVERAVQLTRAALADAGVDPSQLRALYLTGGSSRVPLIHQRLGEIAEVATLDDPKTVVAQGALIGAISGLATARIPEAAGQDVAGHAGAVGADRAGTGDLSGMTAANAVPPLPAQGSGPVGMPAAGAAGLAGAASVAGAMQAFSAPRSFAESHQSYGGYQPNPQDQQHPAQFFSAPGADSGQGAHGHSVAGGGRGGGGSSDRSDSSPTLRKVAIGGGALVVVLVLVLAVAFWSGAFGSKNDKPTVEAVGPGAQGILAALPSELRSSTTCEDHEETTISSKTVQGASCKIDNKKETFGLGRSIYNFSAYADEVGAGAMLEKQRQPSYSGTTPTELTSSSGKFIGFITEGSGYTTMTIVNPNNHLVLDDFFPGARENAEAIWNEGGFAAS